MNIPSKISLKDSEFRKLSRFIYDGYGITLPHSKKTMLEGRLQRRLHQYQFTSFKQYFDLISSPKGKMETNHMIDRVSTNKTDFFREPAHFEFLTQTIVSQHQQRYGAFRPFKIWSSACSSGEEVYSSGIVLEEYGASIGNFNYEIHGTDVSYEILRKALNGVYPSDAIQKIPRHLREKYFLRSKDKSLDLVRVIPKIRHKTSFSRLNLMQAYYGEANTFDLIFCRNVLIYFDRKTQESVINKQCCTLKKGGFFFLGHTESINGMDLPLKQVLPTIYQKV